MYNPIATQELIEKSLGDYDDIKHPHLTVLDVMSGREKLTKHRVPVFAVHLPREDLFGVFLDTFEDKPTMITGFYCPYPVKDVKISCTINDRPHSFRMKNPLQNEGYISFSGRPIIHSLLCGVKLVLFIKLDCKYQECMKVDMKTITFTCLTQPGPGSIWLSDCEKITIQQLRDYFSPDFITSEEPSGEIPPFQKFIDINSELYPGRIIISSRKVPLIHDLVIPKEKIAFDFYEGNYEDRCHDLEYHAKLQKGVDKEYHTISIRKSELSKITSDDLKNYLDRITKDTPRVHYYGEH